jgi:hypothetical protein
MLCDAFSMQVFSSFPIAQAGQVQSRAGGAKW